MVNRPVDACLAQYSDRRNSPNARAQADSVVTGGETSYETRCRRNSWADSLSDCCHSTVAHATTKSPPAVGTGGYSRAHHLTFTRQRRFTFSRGVGGTMNANRGGEAEWGRICSKLCV